MKSPFRPRGKISRRSLHQRSYSTRSSSRPQVVHLLRATESLTYKKKRVIHCEESLLTFPIYQRSGDKHMCRNLSGTSSRSRAAALPSFTPLMTKIAEWAQFSTPARVHARTKAAKGGSPNMTMPFIYVFVSQLLTVIHGRISRRGRARSAGEVEVGDAAGEQAGRLWLGFSVFHRRRPLGKVKLNFRRYKMLAANEECLNFTKEAETKLTYDDKRIGGIGKRADLLCKGIYWNLLKDKRNTLIDSYPQASSAWASSCSTIFQSHQNGTFSVCTLCNLCREGKDGGKLGYAHKDMN